MKYVVRGSNGIMTVYATRQISDVELKLAAQCLAEQQQQVIQSMRQMLYGRRNTVVIGRCRR